MRAVVQRVKGASVSVKGEVTGAVGKGFMVLLGVSRDDSEKDAQYIADKICGLRVFSDEAGKFNLSIDDVKGSVLVVSQFTLYGDARAGRRPSFTEAAGAELGERLYEQVMEKLRGKGLEVHSGIFGASMEVSLINDGPVTILLDSNKTF